MTLGHTYLCYLFNKSKSKLVSVYIMKADGGAEVISTHT